MFRTLVLVVAVMIVAGVLHRWRQVRRHRLLEPGDGDTIDADRLHEITTAEDQLRRVLRFGFVVVLAIGLFTIWSEALPMLQILKRVQLLPTVEMLPEASVDPLVEIAGTEDPGGGEQGAANPETEADEAGGTLDETDAGAEPPLTLWILLQSILAAIVTVVLVRNLPGVFGFMLRRQTTLDSGARIAFVTLLRYTITIIGTIAVFAILGVTWSNVQWLAAALTFGLGFGLQEIVANFVSGIILLAERPVRVGDVVTIGNLMGKVTRIQIRATTITLWDRSEMIVPNKEFITTKLVNWTLSDSKRRIEIPLRIAYGSDLDEVRELLVEIATDHPAVLDEPAPHVLLLGFGDDAILFELRFVVDFGLGLTTKDEVQMAIERAFRDRGIEFALPQRQIRLVTEAEVERGSTTETE
jgi:potassium efflux system protein